MTDKTFLPLPDAGAHSDSYGRPDNGDVICVNRGLYKHYGVYVEGGNVIHYTGANGPDDFNGIVRETSIDEFLNGADRFTICRFPDKPERYDSSYDKKHIIFSIWQEIKNFRLRDYHLYSGDETVRRARSKLGEGGYNLAMNNCEHFAVWCKTGIKDSSQVNKVLDVITYLLG